MLVSALLRVACMKLGAGCLLMFEPQEQQRHHTRTRLLHAEPATTHDAGTQTETIIGLAHATRPLRRKQVPSTETAARSASTAHSPQQCSLVGTAFLMSALVNCGRFVSSAKIT